jgi:hypothetical protein
MILVLYYVHSSIDEFNFFIAFHDIDCTSLYVADYAVASIEDVCYQIAVQEKRSRLEAHEILAIVGDNFSIGSRAKGRIRRKN